MINSEYVAIGGLLIALVGIITGFILQRDNKKIRDLERNNKKYKRRLTKALFAIKSYQTIEEKQAAELEKDAAIYRREIRKKYDELFDSDFTTPNRILEMIADLNND